MSGKLVRDRIIEIMSAQNISTVSRRLGGTQEHLIALRRKLDEEIAEFDAARGYEAMVDELADILEVVYGMGSVRGISPLTVDTHRRKKAAERGQFNEGIWLEGPDA